MYVSWSSFCHLPARSSTRPTRASDLTRPLLLSDIDHQISGYRRVYIITTSFPVSWWSSNLVNRRTRNFSNHPCIDWSLWEVIKRRGKNQERQSQDLIGSPRRSPLYFKQGTWQQISYYVLSLFMTPDDHRFFPLS